MLRRDVFLVDYMFRWVPFLAVPKGSVMKHLIRIWSFQALAPSGHIYVNPQMMKVTALAQGEVSCDKLNSD